MGKSRRSGAMETKNQHIQCIEKVMLLFQNDLKMSSFLENETSSVIEWVDSTRMGNHIVLVQLLRRTAKLGVMQSRRRKTHADSPFVVEDLTTRRYKLLLTARSNPGITSAWWREGNIYALVWGDHGNKRTSRSSHKTQPAGDPPQNRTDNTTQDRRRQAEGPIRRVRSEERRPPWPQRSAVRRTLTAGRMRRARLCQQRGMSFDCEFCHRHLGRVCFCEDCECIC